jgi:hypothetical protein
MYLFYSSDNYAYKIMLLREHLLLLVLMMVSPLVRRTSKKVIWYLYRLQLFLLLQQQHKAKGHNIMWLSKTEKRKSKPYVAKTFASLSVLGRIYYLALVTLVETGNWQRVNHLIKQNL